MKKAFSLGSVCLFALMGCESLGIGKKDKPPLEGDRVPVTLTQDVVALKSQTLSLSVQTVSEDWSQAGGVASHVSPLATLGKDLKPKWQASVGATESGAFLSSPIVVKGRVYLLDSTSQVRALDEKTGGLLWSQSILPEDRDESILGGGVACDGERLFVASPHGEAFALDAKTGKILWKKLLSAPARSAPTLAGNRVYVLGIHNQLDVFDSATGEKIWEHTGIPESAGLLGMASPAVGGGTVIVAYNSGEVFALREENGQPLWLETLAMTRQIDSASNITHIRARPIVDKDRVYVTSQNNKIAALDFKTGQKLWQKEVGGVRTPALVGDYLFLVTRQNNLMAIQSKTGDTVWAQALSVHADLKNRSAWAGPVFAGGRLFLAGLDGRLLEIDPTNGQLIKSHVLPGPCSVSPVVAQGVLYVLTDNGVLVAYH